MTARPVEASGYSLLYPDAGAGWIVAGRVRAYRDKDIHPAPTKEMS
jgi:hypothetical protein